MAHQVSLRVFDVGRGCQQREIAVHVFRRKHPPPVEEFADTVSVRHHTKWAKPGLDVPAAKRLRWRGGFRKIVYYSSSGWEDFSQQKASGEMMRTYPRGVCKTKAKSQEDSLLYNAAEINPMEEEADPHASVEPNRRNGVSDPGVALQGRTGMRDDRRREPHMRSPRITGVELPKISVNPPPGCTERGGFLTHR